MLKLEQTPAFKAQLGRLLLTEPALDRFVAGVSFILERRPHHGKPYQGSTDVYVYTPQDGEAFCDYALFYRLGPAAITLLTIVDRRSNLSYLR